MFEAAGVTPDKEVVTVCQGGIRAAQAAFTLTLLGYENVRDYDGSLRRLGEPGRHAYRVRAPLSSPPRA